MGQERYELKLGGQEDFNEKVTCEQRLEEGEGVNTRAI